VAKRVAARAQVLAVVKANAYGHGVERVQHALPDADGFGILELEGAVAMRKRGFAGPILLLEGFFAREEIPVLAANRLATVIHARSSCACSRRIVPRNRSMCT